MTKRIKRILLFSFSAALLVFAGCKEKELSPIRGSLKCYVDESLYNVIKAERDTFVTLYPNSKIDLVTVKAREGIADVLNGEATLFISSRTLNAEEKSYFEKTKSDMRTFKFCYDAVVPIVSNSESKENLTMDEVKKILTGQTMGFQVFVPDPNSGVYEYLKTSVLGNKEPQKVSIVKSEEEVIQKVKSTRKSLGFVGLNTLENVEGVKILEVGIKRSETDILYYKPYTAYLVSQTYPLIRTTSIFINEVGIGLASGFATFLTSFEGQKIVSKHNLGPATVPVKMVN